jgi:hypothetical protein
MITAVGASVGEYVVDRAQTAPLVEDAGPQDVELAEMLGSGEGGVGPD